MDEIHEGEGELFAKKGFIRVVEIAPATLNTSSLPAGYAFQVEFRTRKTMDAQPVIDVMKASFE